MPVHDWTRVDAGVFHDFHLTWIGEIKRAQNRGLLPAGYYALAEQIASGWEPDVLTLRGPTAGGEPEEHPPGAIALAEAPPKVQFRFTTEAEVYADKARAVVVRHASDHRVIAVVEIVSPGKKSSRHRLRAFVEKAEHMLRAGVHLLIVDLFPPGPRDPQGIHGVVWDAFGDGDFPPPPERPLALAAYLGGDQPQAFVEPIGVGDALPEMPLFLSSKVYIRLPLEPSDPSAWEAVPSFWRDMLTRPPAALSAAP